MTQQAWASTDAHNPPLSTSMRRSWSDRWVFLDSVDFRIHGNAFSHPDSACLAGAYASAIESDLDSLDRQSPARNAALMQEVFPSARYDTVQADLSIDAAASSSSLHPRSNTVPYRGDRNRSTDSWRC